jgi:hypothetical protein
VLGLRLHECRCQAGVPHGELLTFVGELALMAGAIPQRFTLHRGVYVDSTSGSTVGHSVRSFVEAVPFVGPYFDQDDCSVRALVESANQIR